MYFFLKELFSLLYAALGYVSRGDDNRLVPSSTEASRCYSRTQSAQSAEETGVEITRTAQSCYGLERGVVCVGISVPCCSDCVAARVSMYGSGGWNRN